MDGPCPRSGTRHSLVGPDLESSPLYDTPSVVRQGGGTDLSGGVGGSGCRIRTSTPGHSCGSRADPGLQLYYGRVLLTGEDYGRVRPSSGRRGCPYWSSVSCLGIPDVY